MEAAIEFANRYPFAWIVYPLMLVLPIAFVITLLLRPFSSGKKTREDAQQPHSSESTVAASSNKTRGSKKSVKSEQSDGTASSSPKKRSRYIIRGRTGDSEDDHNPQDVSEEEVQKWSFPPSLEEFNLMDLDSDPSDIENLFTDERLIQVVVRLSPSQGLGLTIVGGRDSANGETPIYLKRILPDSVLQRDGKLKAGDQLVAVNDVLLVNATKEHASDILSNVGGVVRLLAIQDL